MVSFSFSNNKEQPIVNQIDNTTVDLNNSVDNSNYASIDKKNNTDIVVNKNSSTNKTINSTYEKTQNQTTKPVKTNDTTNDDYKEQQKTDNDIPRCIVCGAPVQTSGIKCSNCAVNNEKNDNYNKSTD